MHFLTITLALLTTLTTAHYNLLTSNSLQKRQDAFIPDTTPVDACQTGWAECGTRDCILPSRGDVCCSEGYGCPGGSFCLTQGFCCPDGEDPATCAQNNGVSIPPDFNTAPVDPSSLTTSTMASSSVGVSVMPTFAMTSSIGAAVAPTYGVPSYGHSITTTATAALNYTASRTLSTVSQYTGAAVKGQENLVGFMGGVVGAMALGLL